MEVHKHSHHITQKKDMGRIPARILYVVSCSVLRFFSRDCEGAQC